MMSHSGIISCVGRRSIRSCPCCASVRRRPGRRVHALSHPHPGAAGQHGGEAEARRRGVRQRHGHPNPNASWYVGG